MELSELEQSKNKYSLNFLFRNTNMEFVLPLFMGALCSLFVCALAGIFFDVFKNNTQEPEIPAVVYEYKEEIGNFLLSETEVIHDPVLDYFRNPEYSEWVIDFFSNICSNRDIVFAILENSEKFNVPPSLAFSVSWEESRLNPNAINRHNKDGSIDRGLFQLNNRSFPNLETASFFDIKINSHYGLGHLRYCLDTGGSEIPALAMYNAGTGRVRNSGAPEVTLNYVSRILSNKSKIESQFHSLLIKEEEYRLAKDQLAQANAERELKDANIKTFQPQLNRTLISTSPK
jgi:hypothetical protein